MTQLSCLFDTYLTAERSLRPDLLSHALCAAVRLGKNAQEIEMQAVLLMPVVQAQPETLKNLDADLQEVLSVCFRGSTENEITYAKRVGATGNISAVRVALAHLFEYEYGTISEKSTSELTASRRAAIRSLCGGLPAETWSDIAQGTLKPEDSDFLSKPIFDGFEPLLH